MRDARSPFDFVFGLEFFVPGTTICTCHFRRSLVALPEIRESPYPSYKAPRAWIFLDLEIGNLHTLVRADNGP